MPLTELLQDLPDAVGQPFGPCTASHERGSQGQLQHCSQGISAGHLPRFSPVILLVLVMVSILCKPVNRDVRSGLSTLLPPHCENHAKHR